MKAELKQSEIDEVDDFLQHFGVKGMKWGVRKDSKGKIRPRATLSRADRKEAKWIAKNDPRAREKTSATYNSIYSTSASRIRQATRTLNRKPEYKNADFRQDSPLRKKYYDEYSKLVENQLNAVAYQKPFLSNKMLGSSPKKRFTVHFEFDVNKEIAPRMAVKRMDHRRDRKDQRRSANTSLRHADEGLIDVYVTPSYDEMGFIIDTKIEEAKPELTQSDIDDVDDFLQHYGVKGMKWGVIRSKGGKGRPSPKKEDEKKEESSSGGNSSGGSSSSGAPKPGTLVVRKSSVSDLSNADLKAYLERVDLEKRYAKMLAEEQRSNMSKTAKAAEWVKDALKENSKSIAKDYARKYMVAGVEYAIKEATKKKK